MSTLRKGIFTFCVVFCFCVCFCFCGFLSATQVAVQEENNRSQTLGYQLVNSFWNSVMKQDVQSYSSKLACNFQGLNIDGTFNRQDQIAGLSSLTVTSFQLSNLITTRFGKTLVISYDFYATGDGIVSGPSIDVWYKCGKTWKQISHSYVPFNI